MQKKFRIIFLILTMIMTGLSCKTLQGLEQSYPVSPAILTTEAPATSTPAPTLMAPISANQPFKIIGTFKSTSELGGEFSDNLLYSERQVLLIDLHGFIARDKNWEIPVSSQVIGHIDYNPEDASGTYTLFLPEIPQGTLNDVDQNDQLNTGVQVFAIDYEPNLSSDSFIDGNDALRGWPNDMASIKTSNDISREITGGKIIIYSPTAVESFPSSFGIDKKLFTRDDPVQSVPAGYSIVDLNTTPFTISQPAIASLPLIEAADAGPKDYSKETYTQAFDHLISFLRVEYAFNGIQNKQPDWDTLIKNIRPRVQAAEKNKDSFAFYTTLRDITYAFKDGHVGLNGGEFTTRDFQENFSGSLGFTIRILDNNQVLVDRVISGSSADSAGVKVGAVLTRFNGKPVMDAIRQQPLFFGNRSSDISILFGQAITLTRTKPGGQAQIIFKNPGGQEQNVTISAEPEVDTLLQELGYNKSSSLVPVELQTLTLDGKDIGYIKINTFMDDINLLLRLFERGLNKFTKQKTEGLIIDLRSNSGGVPLGLAGYFSPENILLGQIEYYDNVKGQFSTEGERGKFRPKTPQYSFKKIAVLVGLDCASACELEAYAFSQIPNTMIIGQYPSGGIEAEVSKGQVKMPEGIDMQFPTGRIVNPDDSLFLEGVGVQPGIKVPMNEQNALSPNDIILETAEKAVIGN